MLYILTGTHALECEAHSIPLTHADERSCERAEHNSAKDAPHRQHRCAEMSERHSCDVVVERSDDNVHQQKIPAPELFKT